MFCVKCGSRVPDGAAYCGGCGSPLPGAAAAASNQSGWRPAAPVVVQPGPVIGGLPPSHMVKAILATILCCWPTGIAAIVYAAKVTTLIGAGDIEGAWRASRSADTWGNVTVGLGAIAFLIGFVIGLFNALNH